VGDKVVGYLRLSFLLLLGCGGGRGGGHDGDHDGGRDGGRGDDRDGGRDGGHGLGGGHGDDRGGDDDGQVVDGENNVVVRISEVFPLVHGRGGDNEEDHISGVIDPLPLDP
jgi:hypothetical protein